MADFVESQATESKQIFQKPNRPITLKFVDVIYTIKLKSAAKGPDQGKTTEREILRGVSGIVHPGEMMALLGPSGSGKTTLLTALGGRLGGRLSGSVTYNGNAHSSQLKRSMGFVTQDDVLYARLTVTETLVYTALLRLPKSMTKEEKVRQAEAVIAQLNLTKCKNSIIGGHFLRGVSGGERKRVSIGQEMLINPSLLFLDEPTSGLDSTTAETIVSTLSDLAKGGRSILMTIHQPSSKLFYMFDKVLLLSDGNPLYSGHGDAVMKYFDSIGFTPLVPMNPADFLLDIANGISPDGSEDDPAVVKSTLVSAYKQHLATAVKQECEAYNPGVTVDDKPSEKKEVGKYTTTWFEQFSILLRRSLKERKSEAFSKNKLFQVVAVAILCGLLWWRTTSVADQIGLVFFYAGFWGFFPLFNAIFTFPQERSMLAKERTSGMYRLSSYFLARSVGDLPMELGLPTIFIIIVYFMAGLKLTPEAFFINWLSLLLTVLVCQGIGLALGAVFLNQQNATTFGSVLMLAFQLCGGFFVQKVPKFIAWIKYVSVQLYAFRLFLISQFDKHDTYPCATGMCFVKDFPSVKVVGLGDPALAVCMLFVMLLFYRGIAYIALMRVGATPKAK